VPGLQQAQDFPQWRGPNRDGVIAGFAVPATWPRELKRHWQVTVGEGHSSPVVGDGKVFVLARQQDDEVVLCLDLNNGKQLWRQSYAAP
jgi:outer membrane protein assembly factor BamB